MENSTEKATIELYKRGVYSLNVGWAECKGSRLTTDKMTGRVTEGVTGRQDVKREEEEY